MSNASTVTYKDGEVVYTEHWQCLTCKRPLMSHGTGGEAPVLDDPVGTLHTCWKSAYVLAMEKAAEEIRFKGLSIPRDLTRAWDYYQREKKVGLEMKYFVLKPGSGGEHAHASRQAIASYAQSIQKHDPKLAHELIAWVNKIAGGGYYCLSVPRAKDNFHAAWDELQRVVHVTASAKGFTRTLNNWRVEQQEWYISTKLALVHSEISEALEAVRHGNPPDDKIGGEGWSGAEAELADAVIRIMDIGAIMGWDVAGAILAKIDYNKTRPHMHGGKKF